MNIRSGLYGMHQYSAANTTSQGRRSFSFGKYMSNTSNWTDIFDIAVISMPSQFNISMFWHSDSMRNTGNGENYVTTRTASACFNGYGWPNVNNGWDFTRGNGINQGGQWYGNFNHCFLRDYAWAGSPVYVTYHIDILCNDWDKININYP